MVSVGCMGQRRKKMKLPRKQSQIEFIAFWSCMFGMFISGLFWREIFSGRTLRCIKSFFYWLLQ